MMFSGNGFRCCVCVTYGWYFATDVWHMFLVKYKRKAS